MVSEEIKNLIQSLLNEKLEGLSGRINLIESELLNLKKKLFSQEQESKLQDSSLLDKVTLIEFSF